MTSPDKPRLFVDIETYSSVDIRESGAFKYAESDDFEILLIAYAWDHGPVEVIDVTDPFKDKGEYYHILDALVDPMVVKVAHNSAFERRCFHMFTGRYCPVEQWEDTMLMAAMNGLPMSLDDVGAALRLQNQKIKEGSSLIRYFCMPCKPTLSNGGRARNLPGHARDKWTRFIEYCKRDVEVEQAIYYRLAGLPVPEWEKNVWYVDTEINERGVLVDTDFARSAIHVDSAIREKGFRELRRLTGLDNPNSVSQLKEWLDAAGVTVDSLDKTTVSDLKDSLTDPTLLRVLELRQLLGKTSTKKYQAMLNAAGHDNRVRGIMQYYGAGRTGRWAGRLVQPQNFPQNHLEDIDVVREWVKDKDAGLLEMCYPNVPDVLSQLIRTAIVAKPGHTLLIADYAAIEARVIAYLAGEQWRMDVFAQGGDIYCSSASQMFKVPVEKHGVNGHLRQKGKIAELACIAEGQLVLTDVGLVPIECVTTDLKVWDGVEWVNHGGVVYKGEKEVLTYGGLEATEDHIVWAEVNGKARALYFGDAAARGARLIQTGAGRHPLRVGGNRQPGEAVEQIVESLLCTDQVQRVRRGTVATIGQPAERQIEGLPKLHPAESGAAMAGSAFHGREAEMYEPEGRQLQELRSAGHRVPLPERDGGLPVYGGNPRPTIPRDGAGQDRRQRTLRTGEPSLGDTSRELSKPEALPRKVRVYDILNAGPRHRFTVSGVLVHNCGYGGGVKALKAFGADKMGLTDEEMQHIVDQWREASPSIPRFWRNTEKAAVNALRNPGKSFTLTCGVRYYKDADALRCVLPSGRILSYWGAWLEDGKIRFMAQNQTTRKWETADTWGGKLVENIVQAFARDCLAVALLRLSDAGYNVVFHVHDEIIVEEPVGGRTWRNVAAVMGQPIDWAPGLLLRGDGFDTPFYMKD